MKKIERMKKTISEETASNYLKKIINCSDNDLCWCGSKIKYKNCHKNISKNKPSPMGKVFYLFHSLRKKKMCLFPDNRNCSGGIIKAHSIQKSRSLDTLSENGKVYRFELDFSINNDWERFKTLMPKTKGIAETSIFKGFCAFHDKELFKTIDMNVIEPTIEQSILLSIRSIAHEIYSKDIISQMNNIYKEMMHGLSIEQQAKMHEEMRLQQEGIKIGLEDLGEHYTNFFKIYYNKEHSRINRLVIKIEEQPEVMCSGCFTPEFDLNNNLLQDLRKVELLEFMTFEILSNGDHGIIQFCWYDNFQYCKLFIESILESEDIPNTILKLVFITTENHAFKISWFNNLTVLQKKGLMKLFMDRVNADELYSVFKSLQKDKKKYVKWNIKNIEKLF
jgi:hypothetical protein